MNIMIIGTNLLHSYITQNQLFNINHCICQTHGTEWWCTIQL